MIVMMLLTTFFHIGAILNWEWNGANEEETHDHWYRSTQSEEKEEGGCVIWEEEVGGAGEYEG